MENTLRPHQSANNFFYKFYNYNIEDPAMLAIVPNGLYLHAVRELTFFNDNAHISNMDAMQFNVFLFNLIKLNFEKQHNALVEGVKAL